MRFVRYPKGNQDDITSATRCGKRVGIHRAAGRVFGIERFLVLACENAEINRS